VEIDIAPLRERADDVLLLAEDCLRKFGQRLGREDISGLSPEVARVFRLYHWPGNVRELRNVIERAIVLEDGEVISPRCLPLEILTPEFKSPRFERASIDPPDYMFHLPADGISLEDLETSLMKQALAHSNGNQTRAARLLGLSRDQFRYRWKKIREQTRPRLVAVASPH
jgi:DNA-binding NtrC family response regulator